MEEDVSMEEELLRSSTSLPSPGGQSLSGPRQTGGKAVGKTARTGKKRASTGFTRRTRAAGVSLNAE